MTDKKINLDDIITEQNLLVFHEDGYSNYFTEEQRRIIRKAMMEFGEQILESAAENAQMVGYNAHNNNAKNVYDTSVYVNNNNGPDYIYYVDKESITEVLNDTIQE